MLSISTLFRLCYAMPLSDKAYITKIKNKDFFTMDDAEIDRNF